MNSYLNDILSQPSALREALEHYPSSTVEPLRERLLGDDIKRIVLTGMGSSHNAAYPAWLKLLGLPIPAVYVNTAELLHYGRKMIDSRTLLWINSQSGRSVEIVRLLEELNNCRPAFQLSMTNDPESPLARAADLVVPIHAGAESTVSTKTYLNTLAALLLCSSQLAGEPPQPLAGALNLAADAIETYLGAWQEKTAELDALIGDVDQLLILGRGTSMSAVWNGSLVNKEAAKCAFEGMNAADFRHGPMELAGQRLTLLVFEGAPQTASLNRGLALEAASHGARVLWLATHPDPQLPTLLLPGVDEPARPLVEILPLQMLSIVMARRAGLEPGKFKILGKITSVE